MAQNKNLDELGRFRKRWDENIEDKNLDRRACKNIYSDFRADAEDLLRFSDSDFNEALETVKDYNSKLTVALDTNRTQFRIRLLELLSDLKFNIILLKNKIF